MANAVEKLNTIAIANIEKVNTLTDASGHKLLEYLEIPGTSLYGLSLNHNYFSSSMRSKIRKAWKDRSFGLSV